MFNAYAARRIPVLEQAQQYGDYLVSHNVCSAENIRKYISPSSASGLLQWDSVENIDSGISGVLLFLIELYTKSGEVKYKTYIDNSLEELVIYCRQHPTKNYGMYTGRAGVAYVLLQWYHLTGNQLLLESCTDLMKPAAREYLYSDYTTDYLYDGRAGTLLILLQLYLLTGTIALQEDLSAFILKMISGARLSPAGISWINKEEKHLTPACSFAHGAAGIKYVFDRFLPYYPDLISYLTTGIADFIDHNRITDNGGWADNSRHITDQHTLNNYLEAYTHGNRPIFEPSVNHSWANGDAGILMVFPRNSDDESLHETRKCLAAKIAGTDKADMCLYNGLSGFAMSLFSSGEEKYNDLLEETIEKISSYLNTGINRIDCDGGLFHGKPGVLYCLLKYSQPGQTNGHILAPFHEMSGDAEHVAPDLNIDLLLTRKTLISGCYPRTLHMLEATAPALLTACWKQPVKNGAAGEIDHFTAFIGKGISRIIPDTMRLVLADLFQLEKEKLSLLLSEKRSYFQCWLDEQLHQEAALRFLNMPDEWLRDQELVIADKLKVLKTSWNWGFRDDFKRLRSKGTREDHLRNMKLQPDKFEYLLTVSGQGELMEVCLKMDSILLLHCFDTPCTIDQALANIKQYIRSLPADQIKQLLTDLEATQFPDTDYFMDLLDNMIFYQIRQWVYRKFLVTINNDL